MFAGHLHFCSAWMGRTHTGVLFEGFWTSQLAIQHLTGKKSQVRTDVLGWHCCMKMMQLLSKENWGLFYRAAGRESGAFQPCGTADTGGLYHTGDGEEDRSEARLLIDFRKATEPTHTHAHKNTCAPSFPSSRCLTQHTHTHTHTHTLFPKGRHVSL